MISRPPQEQGESEMPKVVLRQKSNDARASKPVVRPSAPQLVAMSTERFHTFAPGKVILFGEHAVVYGEPAVALPLAQGIRVKATPSEKCELSAQMSLNTLQTESLNAAFLSISEKFHAPKFRFSIESTLPVSMGLGSSGAVAVSLVRAVMHAAGKKFDEKKVLKAALALETVFHGKPSGVDHTTSTLGVPLVFKKGSVERLKVRLDGVLLLASVGTRAPTKQTVEALRHRQAQWSTRYKSIFKEIGVVASAGAKAIEKGDLNEVGDAMNMNHGLLCSLGLSSAAIDASVWKMRSLGAHGSKLTGAGGDGGMVIGLFKNESANVAEVALQKECQIVMRVDLAAHRSSYLEPAA